MPEYCVTGGTGFIAAHLIKTLLEKGHTVRATVRDPGNVEKVGFLWELEGSKERLELIKAELLEEGSFDKAVEGVDGVFHTASPVAPPPYGHNVQETVIDPAIKGTVNVLNSCVRARVKRVVLTSSSSTTRGRDDVRQVSPLNDSAVKGTVNVLKSCVKARVQRVVLTSSTATIRFRDDVQQISPLNESHWSDLDYCQKYKLWYMYGKTLAEKEAWKMSNESGLDLVVVVPPFVVGPMLPPLPTSSLLLLLNIIKGTQGGIPNLVVGFVHIDDVICAHILAMEERKASGRYICTGPLAHWSEIVEILKEKYPMYPYENHQLSIDEQGGRLSYDTSKIRELGLRAFKTIPEMLDDCITSFQHKGFL